MSGQDTIYQMVTDKITNALENGTVPWQRPWKYQPPKSMNGDKSYRGINPLLLELTAQEEGFGSPYWGTFNHIRNLGGSVKKGSKSTIVIFWKLLRKPNSDDPKKTDTIPLLRFYRVFNADQTEGLPEKYYAKPDELPVNESAETVLKNYLSEGGPKLKHGGDSAHYNHTDDTITLPPKNTFRNLDGYYATAFHEASHSTGHHTRLKRRDVGEFRHFGSEMHGREELTAEMSAAFLSATVGIETVIDNSADYIHGWLRAIKNDPKIMVKSAAAAQKAADMILGIEWENGDTDAAE